MTVKGEAILRIEKQYKDLILNIGSVSFGERRLCF